MWKYLRNDRGSIVVIVAGALIMLLGFTALVTDIGMMDYHKSKLQNACDAAALAGAQELPDDTTEAESVATQYAVNNGVTNPTITFDEDNHKIIVQGQEEVAFFFARALGINKGDVSAKAAAIVAPINEVYSGLRPFGVEVKEDEFVKGEQVVLKTGAHRNKKGNFHPIGLEYNDKNSGADVYENNIKYGTTRGYAVGDFVDTETGNMSGPTKEGIDYVINLCKHTPKCTWQSYKTDCPRLITVPLIVPDSDKDKNGGKMTVKIVGFARFFLEGCAEDGEKAEVTGRFIQEITVGGTDPGQSDFGLMGVTLVE